MLPCRFTAHRAEAVGVGSTAMLGPARTISLFLHPAPPWLSPALGSLHLRTPSNVDGLLGMETPDRKINVRDTDHCPHAFRDRIELPMLEQTTDKRRHFVLGHCQVDQAILGMAEMTRIKILITGKKGRAS